MLMNVISNIMVAVGATLILIGVIGLTLSWVCEAEEGETAAAGTSSVSASADTFPRGEGSGETKNDQIQTEKGGEDI